MKIVICGSMKFANRMASVRDELEKEGHEVFVPELLHKFVKNKKMQKKHLASGEHSKFKKKHDLIRKHYEKVKKGDAILVLNYDKAGKNNYIGGNTFLEMGFAHILNKPIYLLNSLPGDSSYIEEIRAMNPITINGDLEKIN